MQESVITGIRQAQGDAIVLLQADLQDPPEVILEMAKEWINGASFVATKILRRNDPFTVKAGSWFFYRILRFLSNTPVVMDSSDFYLFDSKFKNPLLATISPRPFIRTTLASISLPDSVINYERLARANGTSNYNHRRRANFAIDAFLSNLGGIARKSVLLSLFASGIAILSSFALLIGFAFGLRSSVGGWASTTIITLFAASINLLILSIILEVVWRVYTSMPRRQDSLPLEVYRAKESQSHI